MTEEQIIGGIVTDIPNLKTVLKTLIDDYTTENGILTVFDGELLYFQQWVDKRYPTEEEPKS